MTDVEQSLPYQNAPSAVNTPKTKTVTKLFDETNVDNGYKNWFEKQEAAVRGIVDGPNVPNNEFTNGWAWSHALRQFFLIYQRERANNPNLELWFTDYKSRATYRCVPRSIQFQQNANTPYLINYTIILKCWQLEDSETEFSAKAINRFQGDLSEVMTASITGIISKISKINNVLNRSPSIAGSFLRNSTSSFL